jgi:glyoxylase I family protein
MQTLQTQTLQTKLRFKRPAAASGGITVAPGGLFASSISEGARAAASTDDTGGGAASPAPSYASVRYQVTDIERSISFYTRRLGFQLERRAGAAFASVTLGPLRLILGGPGSSGSRAMPDGRPQQPGGWNRILIYVSDLTASIAALEKAQVHFRNGVEAGPGGRQILIDDPDGNPIELHEPAHTK